MGLADEMPGIREDIFALIGDVATIGTDTVRGKFFKRYREIQMPDGSISALDLSFDCNVSETILGLAEDDPITIQEVVYKFRRLVPREGDESGLVTIELKS